jgi:hypothetical protein
VILVSNGDSLDVEIEASEQPLGITALIFKWDKGPPQVQKPLQSIPLEANRTASFAVNLPVGLYIVHISSQWPVPPEDIPPNAFVLRTVDYIFKVEVR